MSCASIDQDCRVASCGDAGPARASPESGVLGAPWVKEVKMFNMQSTQRGVRWLTLTLVVALAAGGGWAVAAATTSTGVIHACASKTTGVLRLARKCKMTERPVVWNVQGVPGRNGT